MPALSDERTHDSVGVGVRVRYFEAVQVRRQS